MSLEQRHRYQLTLTGEFNPIELIWAKIKNEVKKKNSNDKQTLKNVEEKTKCDIN